MLIVYSYTKNKVLLDYAIKSYSEYNLRCTNDLCDRVINSNKKPYVHGVSYDEYTKIPAMLYLYTNDKKYLNTAIKAHKKLEKYFMLIDGLHCSDEFMISNKINRSHETCCVSDYTWNLNYMYQATKDSKYLDAIEKCIFNAGIASVTNDFKALQYFSSPNQVILTSSSNHNDFFKGSKWMQYSPNPGTECCPGNVNRFMPNYISNMYALEDDCIVLKMFGSSILSIDGKNVLTQKTNFPYGDEVKIVNLLEQPIKIKIRYPEYCVRISSDNIIYENMDGFFWIELASKEERTIIFNSQVVMHQKDNYAWFTKGPLLYTYNIEAKIQTSGNENFPDYSFLPKSDWQYGISRKSDFEFKNGKIFINVHKVFNWKIKKTTKVKRITSLYKKTYKFIEGEFYFTPNIPKKLKYNLNMEKLELTAYMDSLLRLTAFPFIDN